MDSFSRAGHAHARIEEFLPDYNLSTYHIRVQAPAGVVYDRLLGLDFNKLWVVRLLMTVRSGKRLTRKVVPGDLRQRLEGTGFVVLTKIPDEELVMGVAGRFWRPDGGRCMGLRADDFAGFSHPRLREGSVEFPAG